MIITGPSLSVYDILHPQVVDPTGGETILEPFNKQITIHMFRVSMSHVTHFHDALQVLIYRFVESVKVYICERVELQKAAKLLIPLRRV